MAEELRTSSESTTTQPSRLRGFLQRYRWYLGGLVGIGLAVGVTLAMTGGKDHRSARHADDLAEFSPIQSVTESGSMPLISINSSHEEPSAETRTAELTSPESGEPQPTILDMLHQPEPFSAVPRSLRGKEPVGAWFIGTIEPIQPQYPGSPRP